MMATATMVTNDYDLGCGCQAVVVVMVLMMCDDDDDDDDGHADAWLLVVGGMLSCSFAVAEKMM